MTPAGEQVPKLPDFLKVSANSEDFEPLFEGCVRQKTGDKGWKLPKETAPLPHT